MALNDIETITIRTLGNESQGVGSLSSGKTIFVDGLLPTEEARVRIVAEKSRVAVGECIERLSDSPDRVEPACPYYDSCGGCSCMHMNYDAQARFKESKVREVLNRVGHLENIDAPGVFNPIKAASETTAYRNHMQYSIGDLKIGFKARDSHEVVEVPECLLEYDEFRTIRRIIADSLRNYPTDMFVTLILRGSKRTGEYLMELVAETDAPHELVIRDTSYYIEANRLCERISEALGENCKLMGIVLQICSDQKSKRYRTGKRVALYGVDYFHEELLGKKFRIKAGAFFQVNTKQAEVLYSIVRDNSSEGHVIYDLFCGTGSIGLCVVGNNQQLYGIEVSPEAVASAKVNAELSGVKNAQFVVKQVERFDFAGSKFERADTIIVDPPRKGMDIALVGKLLKMAPERIIYVSCDPATLARDLKMLCDKYRVESVTPVDLFPNSEHVETVVLLTQKSTTHHMKLNPEPFEMIKSGIKTIELRLFDEKRQKIKVGDSIVFTETVTGEKLSVVVEKLHRFDSFDELYNSLPLLKCGYTEQNINDAKPSDMEEYYSVEEQKKYGVVGIEIS